MSIFKIALRSLQFRGIGSLLTIVSMALGVMLVVGVLTIYGVVERSFKSNSSFGYDVIVGARGGSTQLTLNTVFYLSRPVENVPYEYYLAFCDQPTREAELKYSIAYNTHRTRAQLQAIADSASATLPMSGPLDLFASGSSAARQEREEKEMGLNRNGDMYLYTDTAVPLALGDYFNEKFRVVGTTPDFFKELVLDVDTGEKFEFSAGRVFETYSEENGYFECVLGAIVARESGVQVGDVIYPIHGGGDVQTAHTHEQGFTVVGILEPSATPNDRVAFINLEGHYLMEDHAKPIEESSLLGQVDSGARFAEAPAEAEANSLVSWRRSDVLNQADQASTDDFASIGTSQAATGPQTEGPQATGPQATGPQAAGSQRRTRLPVEQREVTAVLVRSYTGEDESEAEGDEFGDFGGAAGFGPETAPSEEEEVAPSDDDFMQMGLSSSIIGLVDEGQLESTLDWSFFRPKRSQRAADAVNPVEEVTLLFANIVSPIRWLLLVLTIMICVVSGISILVGIYNSMAQRRHELAIMRALGASRYKVMSVMFMESVMLAAGGGLLGWIAGHALNVAVSPYVETSTGVTLGWFTFAPPVPFLTWILPQGLPLFPNVDLTTVQVSPEFLLIPGIVLLAVIVGIYPAITAYRTDVASSLSD